MRKAAVTKPKKASRARLAAAGTRQVAAARITLPADCTLREAAVLQALLVSTISPTSSVIVEGGAVTRIDAAALQLLAAFARRERAAGRQVEWQSASDDLNKASAMLGLSEVLQLPASAGALA